MLASPKNRWRLRVHAGSVAAIFAGQALPLIKLRFWGSRIGRGTSAQKLIHDRLTVACSWTVRGLGLDLNTDKSRTRPRSRTDNGCGLFTDTANPCQRLVRGQVHVRGLPVSLSATAENCAALARPLRALQVLMKIRGKAYGRLNSFRRANAPMSQPDRTMNLVSQRHLCRIVLWQSDSCEHIR